MLRNLPAVIEQHAENAAFLWLVRSRSVDAPHLRLRDIVSLDSRLDAHLQGLLLAGDDGWNVCREALTHKEAGEVFAAAVLAFSGGRDERVTTVLDVAISVPSLIRPVVSALGWIEEPLAASFIRAFTSADSMLLKRVGVAAAAAHRRDPGPVIDTCLTSATDPLLISRALRAVGELGLVRALPAILPLLEATDDRVRFTAGWAAALLGERTAVPVLGGFAADGGPYAERACAVGLRLLPAGAAYRAHEELAGRPGLGRLAILAAGFIGDPALADWLLVQMRTPSLARLAGRAFAMMTGCDLEHPSVAGQPPDGFDAGPNDDPKDERVELDPDEHLPWPDPDKLHDWWFDYRSEFRSGTRYLLGNEIGVPWLRQVIETGTQTQRAASAIELVVRRPGSVLFEVRAPGPLQVQRLGLR